LKKLFGGVFIGNEKFTKETAKAAIGAGVVDAVAFGKSFIANPDLPLRFKLDAPLNTPEPSSFYGGDARGYLDYPVLEPESVRA
jgi:2,4-dienoyl-CoA reductase-like NADH-dependent reductase (Old Yellow Enzyme family)